MVDKKSFIQVLFQKYDIVVSSDRETLFDEFVQESEKIVEQIRNHQQVLMENWKLKNRIYDIVVQQIVIPNGKVGEPYQAKIDLENLNLRDLSYATIETDSETGLSFDKETNSITGTPVKSGDFKFKFLFRVKGEPENITLHEKQLLIIINPDPKTLWKNLPSDKNAIFWKKDDHYTYKQLGVKHIIAASKRGRSHQNAGLFRDDDFAFSYIEKNEWSVVAVADGAGSYPLSRKGSQIACNTIIDYFQQNDDFDLDKDFEVKIQSFIQTKDETALKQAENLSKQILYKATVATHNKIKEFAVKTSEEHPEIFNNPRAKNALDYFHTTLIFAMFKKYNFGYLILTFGVGDCPIAVMNKEKTETKLLNWLDVGEFGGGTRFITQPEIFHSTEHPMITRFNFYIINDFSYLFLMTDGIYDPKFIVEANLEKHEKWLEFLEDLQGKNEDGTKVVFETIQTNTNPSLLLMGWLDFWDKGNHDDRTLAIVF
jgi:serine/threonine protein phosphatase PrpC